jgi:hypothetical protein
MICFLLLTQFCGREVPLFRPHFLGEKFPTLDYLVELVNAGPATPFCFVQVKTTTRGYTQPKTGARRFRVQISADDMRRLRLYPAPTYIIGIDERTEVGYISAADQHSPNRLTSLSTQFLVNCENLERLWHEVREYWRQRDMRLPRSVFSELQEGGSDA